MIRYNFNFAGPRKGRFLRKSATGDHYEFCEQSAEKPHLDLAQGTCSAEDLPDDVRAKCDAYAGSFYACEWPL